MPFIDQVELFQKTNGGLEVILHYYPQAASCVDKKNSKFKLRSTEKTASASLRLNSNQQWCVTDFGADSKEKNAIQVCMHEENCSFKEALDIIAGMFGIAGAAQTKVKANYSKTKAKKGQQKGDFDYKTKDSLSKFELSVIGKYVTPEACEKYYLKSLLWYTKVNTDKETGELVVHKYESTEEYPIFIYEYPEFKKIYQPLSYDKNFRFMYSGTRPTDIIFGLEQCQAAQKIVEKRATDEAEINGETVKSNDCKLEEIILCSGDRDAINVSCAGKNVVWLGSETASFTFAQYKKLKTLAKVIYNLPDIDATGIKQAYKVGLAYLDIRTIYLPDELKLKRSFRGGTCNDATDYFKYYTISAFNSLMTTALPLQFWDEEHKFKKGEFDKTIYKVNNVQMYYFLHVNGFCRIENKSNKDMFNYVRIEKNTVRVIEDKSEIKGFIHDFLKTRHKPIELRNTFYRTQYLSDNSLSNLKKVEIDFNDCDQHSQFMFFDNAVWKITAEEITTYKRGEVGKYVWDNEIIPQKVRLLDPPFQILKDENGEWDVTTPTEKPDCLFFQFLQCTSDMYWEKRENNEELSDAEVQETVNHLVNKIYSIGYLLHKFKNPNRPWATWAMDNKIVDTKESHGGSGKSVCFKAIRYFMQSITLPGRDARLTENNHLFERVTKHTDFVLIDDANPYLDFDFFFPAVTGEVIVNPKGTKSHEIQFEDVPKLGFTSNYPPKSDDQSTLRRLLFLVFSDFFHFNKDDEYTSDRTIGDYFGKNLFTEFTKEEWNYFINFMAHCLKFYLSHGKKIDPPLVNVKKRQLKSKMGDGFHEWADAFFCNSNMNTEVEKIKVFEDYKTNGGANPKFNTPQRFKKQLLSWCKYYGYEFAKGTGSNGRIIRSFNGTTTEYIQINAQELLHRGEVIMESPFN